MRMARSQAAIGSARNNEKVGFASAGRDRLRYQCECVLFRLWHKGALGPKRRHKHKVSHARAASSMHVQHAFEAHYAHEPALYSLLRFTPLKLSLERTLQASLSRSAS